MKQTFQSAAKFFGFLLIAVVLSNTVAAQSSENTVITLQATGVSATPVSAPVISTPQYKGGTPDNSNTVNQPAPVQTITADAPAYLNTVPAGTNTTRNGNTISTVNADGSVSVTVIVNGVAKTSVISKPVMNTSQPMGYDMDAYIADYYSWMKLNPDFAKYISARELEFILQDNFSGLYKSNFMVSQKLSSTK